MRKPRKSILLNYWSTSKTYRRVQLRPQSANVWLRSFHLETNTYVSNTKIVMSTSDCWLLDIVIFTYNKATLSLQWWKYKACKETKREKILCDRNVDQKQRIHCDWNTKTPKVPGTSAVMGVHLHNCLIDDSNEWRSAKAPAQTILLTTIEPKSNGKVLHWLKSTKGTFPCRSVTSK